jgi:hypothetical protein
VTFKLINRDLFAHLSNLAAKNIISAVPRESDILNGFNHWAQDAVVSFLRGEIAEAEEKKSL